MKYWQPGYTITTNECLSCVQTAELYHLPPVSPRAPGRRTIIRQCHNATLLTDPYPKTIKPANR